MKKMLLLAGLALGMSQAAAGDYQTPARTGGVDAMSTRAPRAATAVRRGLTYPGASQQTWSEAFHQDLNLTVTPFLTGVALYFPGESLSGKSFAEVRKAAGDQAAMITLALRGVKATIEAKSAELNTVAGSAENAEASRQALFAYDDIALVLRWASEI